MRLQRQHLLLGAADVTGDTVEARLVWCRRFSISREYLLRDLHTCAEYAETDMRASMQ